ncbi:hypothetical protein JXA59_00480 [Patescibacteria group bacterium]|nr:hypothetical protein [Patescibacteria group bacterium]
MKVNSRTNKKVKSTFLWITEEWLIILIAVLILLAIAISAAGARTLLNPTIIIGPGQTMSASVAGTEDQE